MLGMVALYIGVLVSKHRVDHVGKVSVKTHPYDVVGTNVPPPAANDGNVKDPEVSNTSGIAAKCS